MHARWASSQQVYDIAVAMGMMTSPTSNGVRVDANGRRVSTAAGDGVLSPYGSKLLKTLSDGARNSISSDERSSMERKKMLVVAELQARASLGFALCHKLESSEPEERRQSLRMLKYRQRQVVVE